MHGGRVDESPVEVAVDADGNGGNGGEGFWRRKSSRGGRGGKNGRINATATTGVHLVTTFFRGGSSSRYSERRFQELVEAQRQNIGLSIVRAVHMFVDRRDVDPYAHLPRSHHAKLRIVPHSGGVPTWGEMLRFANEHLEGMTVLVAHADMMFDESLSMASTLLRLSTSVEVPAGNATSVAVALTRQPHERCVWQSGGGHKHRRPVDLCTGPAGKATTEGVIGYDAFGAVPPLPEPLLQIADSLTINSLGADLVMVEALADSGGYMVVDPCVLIRASHVHCTQERGHSFEEVRAAQMYPPPPPAAPRARTHTLTQTHKTA